MTTTITSIGNSGGGNYDVHMTSDATYLGGADEPSLIMYSPTTDSWLSSQFQSTLGSGQIQINRIDDADDCTLLIVIATPTTFSTTPPLEIATPINAVT